VPRSSGASRAPDALYFALRNRKLVAGLSIVLAFLLLAIVGPAG
jgi:hypothetical protein